MRNVSAEIRAAANVSAIGWMMATAASIYGILSLQVGLYMLAEAAFAYVIVMAGCSTVAWLIAYPAMHPEWQPKALRARLMRLLGSTPPAK